jgi:hypothetical protein
MEDTKEADVIPAGFLKAPPKVMATTEANPDETPSPTQAEVDATKLMTPLEPPPDVLNPEAAKTKRIEGQPSGAYKTRIARPAEEPKAE